MYGIKKNIIVVQEKKILKHRTNKKQKNKHTALS